MKAFKVNSDTVAALLSREEAQKTSVLAAARLAFSSIGENAPNGLDITAYANGESLLIFAAKKKNALFDITKHYPKVM